MMMNWGWGMGLGWVYMLVLWAAVITAVIYIVKFVDRHSDAGTWRETPLDILKRRYANGEITKEEFEARKGDIGRS